MRASRGLRRPAHAQCRHCRHRTSPTAGTIFVYTKVPLTKWFLAMDFLTRPKNAIAALELKRHLGVSYLTAWSIKHKLLHVMLERDAERQPTGVIEIDDVSRGGECHGETPGRGSPDQTLCVAAVAENHAGHPIALRMNVVEGLRKTAPAAWAAKFIHPDSSVGGDGLACCRGIAPRAMVTGSGAAGVELPERTWVNTVPGHVKTAMKGSCHKAGPRYLPRDFAEFRYRFNRRFDRAAMLPRLAVAAARTPPMPDRLLALAGAHW